MLMILDGFGLSARIEGNAIAEAEKPALDQIFKTYPGTRLSASGLAVGLPDGQMGNSEVGHLNIGAGRVVYQELTRISKSIEEGDFFLITLPSMKPWTAPWREDLLFICWVYYPMAAFTVTSVISLLYWIWQREKG